MKAFKNEVQQIEWRQAQINKEEVKKENFMKSFKRVTIAGPEISQVALQQETCCAIITAQ